MVQNRTQSKIVADVLTAALDGNVGGDGVTVSTLIRKGNVSHTRLMKLVGELVGFGLLVEVREDQKTSAPRYRTSEKGVGFIRTIKEMDEFVQSSGLRL